MWAITFSPFSLASLPILIITLGLLTPLIAALPSPATATPQVPSAILTSADSTITLFAIPPSLKFQAKYHMTTYWSCVTWPDQSIYCGTHQPVLPGGTDLVGAGPCATAKVVAAMGAAVGAVVIAGL